VWNRRRRDTESRKILIIGEAVARSIAGHYAPILSDRSTVLMS